jgi:hypothetical protein
LRGLRLNERSSILGLRLNKGRLNKGRLNQVLRL